MKGMDELNETNTQKFIHFFRCIRVSLCVYVNLTVELNRNSKWHL